MSIQITNLTKTFGSFTALKNISLTVGTGELLALLGPSGCGKTTLLRIIAGLETPDPGSGAVIFHEEDVTNSGVRQRQVGFVFQHYSLFRHMNIFDNIAFGLNVRPRKSRPSKEEISQRVHALLKLVQLERHAALYPRQLSGGQRQRVALARSLAVEPRILLLDEPFGALDAKVRKDLRRWLRRLHEEISITSVFVTHDQDEAMEVADRIVVMNHGEIEQIGTPQEVYDHPANEFVYHFIGDVNLFHGRLEEGKVRIESSEAGKEKPEVVAYVRPHEIELSRTAHPEAIAARVQHLSIAGPVARIQLVRLDTNQSVEAEITRQLYDELQLRTGETVYVNLRNLRVFRPEERTRP
ncbi:MAG: sulfate ABC transporter ATP-binding protein [Planctomycetaceae bacterium]|nr:sulfate ABC transporter ATP-binding protein [Planctomycetaceae bacterium]